MHSGDAAGGTPARAWHTVGTPQDAILPLLFSLGRTDLRGAFLDAFHFRLDNTTFAFSESIF